MVPSSRLSVAALVAVSFASVAAGDVVVGWTITSAFPVNPPPTGTAYSVGAADQGANAVGSALSGTHASTATAWTSPAGNGSQFSFSSNNWAIGDYYEARFSTTGYEGLTLSWDQARSSTGPLSWELIVSTDGGANFSTLLNYDVLQSGGGGAPGTWSSMTYNPIYTTLINLGSDLNDLGDVILRFRALTSPGGASGSSRIDNVFVNGTLIPAPGVAAMLGVAGLLGARRRRR